MCSVLVALCAIAFYVPTIVGDCDIFSLKATCTHLNDIDDYGNERWQEIIINNTNNEPLQQLPKNTFTSTPNVRYMRIIGWLNNFEPGALNGIKSLYSIAFENNSIPVLPPNIFSYMNVNTIDLYNSGIQVLRPGCFRNVKGFEKLNIMYNPLRQVRRDIFNNLEISDLYIQYCQVTTIEDRAFNDMKNLEILSLRGNHLTEFDAPRVIGKNQIIAWLSLRDNHITRMTPTMLKDLPEIQTISLENNRIQVVERDSFSSTHSKLEQIYFNNNTLEVITADIFPVSGLPKLEYLYVDYNRLTYLDLSIMNRLPYLQQLCVGGNPFFCGCNADIITWRESKKVTCYRDARHFQSGQRPSCVAVHNDKCVFGDNSPDTVSAVQAYIDQLPEYIDDT